MTCKIMSSKCATCIFHPDNRMHLSPGRLAKMTRQTDHDDSNVICHQSEGLMGKVDGRVWCAGSVERKPGKAVRLAEWLGIVELIEPPEEAINVRTKNVQKLES